MIRRACPRVDLLRSGDDRRNARQANDQAAEAEATIAVVVITHERLNLIRQCVENTLSRVSASTTEIVIWNNGSADGTRAYLDSLADSRIRVVHSSDNIGLDAFAEAVRLTSASHIIELDDDVTGAPPEWDRTLLEAYSRLPNIGYLVADVEEDDHDPVSLLRHRLRPHQYTEFELNGIRLLEGPSGGYCSMTHRELYEEAGGFPQHPDQAWYQEDAEYIVAIERHGYRPAVLADLRVHHTGGPYYGKLPQGKKEYWQEYWKTVRRKNAVKRFLMRVPFVSGLNSRFDWFGPVEWEPQDDLELPGHQ